MKLVDLFIMHSQYYSSHWVAANSASNGPFAFENVLTQLSQWLHWYSEGWCPLARAFSSMPCLLRLFRCPLPSIQPSHSEMTGYFASKNHNSYSSSLTVWVSVPLSRGLFCVVDRLSLDFISCLARVTCTGGTQCTQRTLIRRRKRFYWKRWGQREQLSPQLKSELPTG